MSGDKEWRVIQPAETTLLVSRNVHVDVGHSRNMLGRVETGNCCLNCFLVLKKILIFSLDFGSNFGQKSFDKSFYHVYWSDYQWKICGI